MNKSILYSYKKEMCQKKNDFEIFFNFSFDKGRLKSFVLWFLRNYGQNKTIGLLEQFKEIGFSYATKAGISLGIDDLKTPPQKNDLLIQAEQKTKESMIQYKRGEITGIERIQKFMDTWHQTSENLKKEVVRHFESTDILNPVYMMAFSGARGNLSQVRQLVGMRGLMSDPQGKIIDFPIQSHFREGLTLTEYLISTYGARKGIVDTALRTANAGYLTRRLVDVAQHVIVSELDCGTSRGIVVFEMKEGSKTIYSLQNRLIGRVLAKDIHINHEKIASRNDEISEEFAISLSKLTKKILIRSPLTCQTPKFVCQLCYGWSLSTNRLVSIGETVGVIAAQSIGEPGTQLTMRTFHTGGVFSGGISDQIIAPYDGIVEYQVPITGICVRTLQGDIAFLTKSEGSMVLKPSISILQTDGLSNVSRMSVQRTNQLFHIPPYTLLFARNGQKVFKRQMIAQLTSSSTRTKQRSDDEQILYSDYEGETYYSYIDVFEKSDKFQDKTFQVWNWGYFWVLSGKIYQFPIESYLFPQPGDVVDRNATLNRISWMTPESCFLNTNSKFQHLKSPNPNPKMQKNVLPFQDQPLSNSLFSIGSSIPFVERQYKKSKKNNISSINHRYADIYKKSITSSRTGGVDCFSFFQFPHLASSTLPISIDLYTIRKKHSRHFQRDFKKRQNIQTKTLQNHKKTPYSICQYSKVLNQRNFFPSFYVSYNFRNLNDSYFSQRQKWILDFFSKKSANYLGYESFNSKLEKTLKLNTFKSLTKDSSLHGSLNSQTHKQIDSTLLTRSIQNPYIRLKHQRFNYRLFSIYHYPFQEFLKSEQIVHKKTYSFYKIKKTIYKKFRIFLYDSLQKDLFYKKTIKSQMKYIFKKIQFQKNDCSLYIRNRYSTYKTDSKHVEMYMVSPYFRFSHFSYHYKGNDVSDVVLNRSTFLLEIKKNKNTTKSKKYSIVNQTNMDKSKNIMVQKNVFSVDINNLFFKNLSYQFMFRFSQPFGLRLLDLKNERVDQMFFFNSFNEFCSKNRFRQNTYDWSPQSTLFLKWLPSEFQTKHSGLFLLSNPFLNVYDSSGLNSPITDSLLRVVKNRNPYQLGLFLEIQTSQLSYPFSTLISSSLFGSSKIKIHYLNKTVANIIQGNIVSNFDFQKWIPILKIHPNIHFSPLNTLRIYHPFLPVRDQKETFKDQKMIYIQSNVYNSTEILEKRFKNVSSIFGFYKFQEHFYPIYKKWFLIYLFKMKNDKTDIFLKNLFYRKQNYKLFSIQKSDFFLLENLFKKHFLLNSVKKHHFNTNKFVFMNKKNTLRQMKLFPVFPIYENDQFLKNSSSSIKKFVKNHTIFSYSLKSTKPMKFQKTLSLITPNMSHYKIMGFDTLKYSYQSNLYLKDKSLFLNHSSMVHKPKKDDVIDLYSQMHSYSQMYPKYSLSYTNILYKANPFMKRLKLLIFRPIFTHENSSIEFQKYHKFFVQKHLSFFQKTQDTFKPLYQYRNRNSNLLLKQMKPFMIIPKSKLSVNCYELFWLPQESYFLNISKISLFHSKTEDILLTQPFLSFLINSNTLIFNMLNRQGLKKPFSSNLNGILKISVKKINKFHKILLKSRMKPVSLYCENPKISNVLLKNKKHLKGFDLLYTSLKEKLLNVFIKKWQSVASRTREKSDPHDWYFGQNFKDVKKSENLEDINRLTFSKSNLLNMLKKLRVQTPFLTQFFFVNDSKQQKRNPFDRETASDLKTLSLNVSIKQESEKQVFAPIKIHKQIRNHNSTNINKESVSIQIQQGWIYLSIQKPLNIYDFHKNHAKQVKPSNLSQIFSGIHNHHSFFHPGKTIIHDVSFENHRVYTQRTILDSIQKDSYLQFHKNNQIQSFKISNILTNQNSRFGNIEFNERFHIKTEKNSLSTEHSSIIALVIQPMHYKILPNPYFYKKKISCSQKKTNSPFFSMLLKKHFHSYLLNKQISDKKILSLYPSLDFKVFSDFNIHFLEKKKNQKTLNSGFWNFKKTKKSLSSRKPKKSWNTKIKGYSDSMKSFTHQKINNLSKSKHYFYFSYYPLNFFSLKLDLLNPQQFYYPFNHSYIELNRFNYPIFSFKESLLNLNCKRLNEFILQKNKTKEFLNPFSKSSYSMFNIPFYPVQKNTCQKLVFVHSLESISLSYQGPSFKLLLTENMSRFANQKLASRFITNHSVNQASSSFISNFPIFKNQFSLTSINHLFSRKYCGLTSFFSPLKGEILPYKKQTGVSHTQKRLILTKSDLFSIYIHPNFYLEYSHIDFIFKKNTNKFVLHKNIFKNKEFEIKQYCNVQKRKHEFKMFLNQFHESFLKTEAILKKKYDFPVFKPINILIQHENKLYKMNGLRMGLENPYRKLRIGSFLIYGDVVYPDYSIQKAGRIVHLSSTKVTFRYAQAIYASPKGILHTYNGDFVNKGDAIITLPFQTLKTGDIVQGIPKVEQYFEARTTKAGRLFIDSLPNLLYGLFERYRSVLPLEKAVRQSLLKIQQIVMNGVQRVYRSQGVGIVDKHLEVIVRQMTSKVEITNAGQSGFFPGERVDIEFIEYVNKFLKLKILYQPMILGITRASLEVESFLSAASFQQTTKILSKAAIIRKKDFLRGLKENLIVVNLIPAGTGYLVYLNDLQISKQTSLK